MTKLTQAEIDAAYDAGKLAYRKDEGSHGPTLKRVVNTTTRNPHPYGTKLNTAWTRGYYQDVRRVIA